MEQDKAFSFKKSLPLAAFVIILAKVCLSIALMIKEAAPVTTEDMLTEIREFGDIATWAVVALWFLHIYLYMDRTIGRQAMRHGTNVVIVMIMLKYAMSIAYTLYMFEFTAWGMMYTVLEGVIWLYIVTYMLNLWRKVHKASVKHHPKKEKLYTFRDELARKMTKSNPYK